MFNMSKISEQHMQQTENCKHDIKNVMYGADERSNQTKYR